MKSIFTFRQFLNLKSVQLLKHSKWPDYLFRPLKILFFTLLFFISSTSFSQTFPSASSCTSKDLSLVAATLPSTPCETCTPGTTITKALTLGINNKTGSTRTSFAFWATLKIINPDGSVASTTPISMCFSTIPKNATTSFLYGNLSYLCGQSLELTNIWEAWTDASPGATCPILLANTSTINPKCGTNPLLNIVSGVDANIDTVNATCTTSGSIKVKPYGGKAPYKVALGNNTPVSVAVGDSITFSNLAPGTYTISLTDANNCPNPVIRTRTIVATGSVATPAATVTQPTCTVSTATVNVTSPVSGVTYTLTQSGAVKYTASSGTFSSVIPGTYGLTASNGSCSSSGSNVVVNAQPTTPATPSAGVTQPTCSVSTATVTVTSPVSGVTYILTQSGVVKYTAASDGTFSSVATGIYGLTASNGTCSSTGSDVTVNAQPATPPTPSASVTQPTCSVSTATVTVTSPVSGVTYTLTQSGVVKYTAASDGTLSSVATGNYGLTASNGTCSSTGSNVTVNAQPAAPATPSANVTQPTCTVSTATVTVTSPESGVTYTLTQSGVVKYIAASDGTFSSVATGTYGLNASNATCSSTGSDVTVNAQPASPTFTVCLVQPTLCANSGSVTISASGGSGFTYSINGTVFTNTTGIFDNLGSGSVTSIQVKNSDGCISAPVSCNDLTSNCTPPPVIGIVAPNQSIKIASDQTTVKAYPNPFNNQVKFVVNAAHSGNGTLEIFNVLGQKVKTVYHGYVPAGVNNFDLNLPGQKNANLIYRFILDNKLVTGKLIQLNQ